MTAAQGDITASGDMPRPPAPPGWEECAVCGCWEMAACWSEESGSCRWVEEDLCSHCATQAEAGPPAVEGIAAKVGLRGGERA
ncbi:MAG: hypothetical protein F4103_16655 [Boseongicola sp. SB0673_bin_14]|nr:hypothetical protein [Boseongicola sp. SB0667_bin_21]MYI70292.1 hypothetical protein [Boseongicola sp. SB0673_bin_14]